MRFSPLITVIVSFTQLNLCWKGSLPLLRKRLLPVHKMFLSMKKYHLCSFSVNVFKKTHKVDLFVCGDTLSLIAHPSGIIMSPPTRNTYWLGVITSTKYFLVSTSSHFASLCLELSFLSPRVALGNFSDYSSLVLLCGSVPLRVFSSVFASSSSILFLFFFFLVIFFFIDERSISVADLLLTATTFFISFFCFFSIFNGVQKC